MAPSKPARSLKVRVPRQNAHRLGPSVTAEVQKIARQEGILVQLPPPVQEQPNSTAASSENASEWNSLLINARAARGPQWDVGTQQFLVEKGSELYYDPTPLQEAARVAAASKDGARSSQQQNDASQSATPNYAQQQQQPRTPYQTQQQYAFSNVSSPMMAQQRSSGYPGTPMRAGTPGGPQYYSDAMTTPTRSGHAPMDATPENRRITRGMSEFQGMYGNQ